MTLREQPSQPRRCGEPRSVSHEVALPEGFCFGRGRYQILHVLARGGTSIVYRAIDRQNGEAVAVKVVSLRCDRPDTQARYENDLRLSDHLAAHPSFARPLALGRLAGPKGFEGRLYLVSELVDGRSLEHLLQEHYNGLPLEHACWLALEIAEALAHLHACGIVHRDIKPGNLVATDDRRVTIIDFGLAYATGDGPPDRSLDLTLPDEAPGTLAYMPPEQVLHVPPTSAFDIYAFGITLYELLTGVLPFDAELPKTIAAKKLDPHAKPLPLARLRPDAPLALAALVARCMAYEPTARPSASDIAKELRLLLSEARRDADRITPLMSPVANARVDDRSSRAIAGQFEIPTDAPSDQAAEPPAVEPPAAEPIQLTARSFWLPTVAVLVPALLTSGMIILEPLRGASEPPARGHSHAAMTIWPEPTARPASHRPRAAPSALESPLPPPRARPSPPEAASPPLPRPAPAAPRLPIPARGSDAPASDADTPTCLRARQAARAAAERFDWHGVLGLTTDPACWPARLDWQRLRVEALAEVGDHERCTALARGTQDLRVRRMASLCRPIP